MPQFEMHFASNEDQREFAKLDEFTQGYVEAMFWTECTSDNPELEECNFEDLAPEALGDICGACKEFQADNAELLDLYAEHREMSSAGVDFWLTRNHHGAGFWDRGLPGSLGDKLTDAAHAWGERYLYVGDDGKLYCG